MCKVGMNYSGVVSFLFDVYLVCGQLHSVRFIKRLGENLRSNRPVLAKIQGEKISRIRCSSECSKIPKCGGYNVEGSGANTVCELTQSFTLPNEVTAKMNSTYYAKAGLGPVDCCDMYNHSQSTSGVYRAQIGSVPKDVLCDMNTGGGGWTVILARYDGSENFFRDWRDYRDGFGSYAGEFWFGLEWIHKLTSDGRSYTLRFDLTSHSGKEGFTEYRDFTLSDESTFYTMNYGTWHGPAGHSLEQNKGQPFSTYDNYNNVHTHSCNMAVMFSAGWWFYNFGVFGFPTAPYGSFPPNAVCGGTSTMNGMFWTPWLAWTDRIKTVQMKIRPQ